MFPPKEIKSPVTISPLHPCCRCGGQVCCWWVSWMTCYRRGDRNRNLSVGKSLLSRVLLSKSNDTIETKRDSMCTYSTVLNYQSCSSWSGFIYQCSKLCMKRSIPSRNPSVRGWKRVGDLRFFWVATSNGIFQPLPGNGCLDLHSNRYQIFEMTFVSYFSHDMFGE